MASAARRNNCTFAIVNAAVRAKSNNSCIKNFNRCNHDFVNITIADVIAPQGIFSAKLYTKDRMLKEQAAFEGTW